MASKTFAIVCAFAIFNAVNSQVLNRIIPGLGPNVVENFIPNQVVVNPFVQTAVPNLINYEIPFSVDSILSAPVTVPATTTIIQDSTVANNLANALQLLVVSNLLSNTLPSMNDVVIPSCAAPVDVISPLALGGLPGYSYVF